MRFAVSNSAAHERSRTRRKSRVNDINIKSHRKTAGRAGRNFYRIFDTRQHSASINVAHREKIISQSEIVNSFLFACVQISRADVGEKFRIQFRRKTLQINEFSVSIAKNCRKRHSVNIA